MVRLLTLGRRAVRPGCEMPTELNASLRLSGCFGLAELLGIRFTLSLYDGRWRQGFDLFGPQASEFTPEGRRRGRCHAEHFGNFLPIESAAIRARHGSTLFRKFVTRLLQTRVGEL